MVITPLTRGNNLPRWVHETENLYFFRFINCRMETRQSNSVRYPNLGLKDTDQIGLWMFVAGVADDLERLMKEGEEVD